MDSILSAAGGKTKAGVSYKPSPATKSSPASQAKTGSKATSAAKVTPLPKVKSSKAAPLFKFSSGVTTKALGICAEEIGISVSDLSDQSSFAELGVDSLLSLTVSGKFRELLDVEIPSSLFVDYPTVKDLKQYLTQFDPEDSSQERPLDASRASSAELSTELTSGATTPALETGSQSSISSDEDSVGPKSNGGQLATTIKSTVADELGVPAGEIGAATDLAELGMDSLMSLSVLGKLREETGEDLPSDFFTEHTTLGDIEKSFQSDSQPQSPTRQEDESNRESKPANKSPPASSILMQGNPKTASRNLFLFPDGSGSAT